jgi:large subunit ribosomal protein L21
MIDDESNQSENTTSKGLEDNIEAAKPTISNDSGNTKTPAAASPYAIIHLQGSQFKVSAGEKLTVNRLQVSDANEEIVIDKVLFYSEGQHIGAPYLPSVRVIAKLNRDLRGEKIRIFKKKRRKNYQKTIGHKQDLSELNILRIEHI